MHDAELRIREEVVEITGGGGSELGRADAVKVVERVSIAGSSRRLLVAHAGREDLIAARSTLTGQHLAGRHLDSPQAGAKAAEWDP